MIYPCVRANMHWAREAQRRTHMKTFEMQHALDEKTIRKYFGAIVVESVCRTVKGT